MRATSATHRWDEFVVVVTDSLEEILGERISGLGPTTHLLDDVGLDSFGVLLLIDQLEDRLGVPVPESALEPTVGNLFGVVNDARR